MPRELQRCGYTQDTEEGREYLQNQIPPVQIDRRLAPLRRAVITLLGGAAAAWPRMARGQFNPAIIGVLGSGSAQSSAFLIGALKEGMNENGLAEGRDYVLDVRWAEGDYTRFAALAFELLERKSSLIIVTTIAAARAAQQAAPPLALRGRSKREGVEAAVAGDKQPVLRCDQRLKMA
jgi:hypothetical protein